MSKEMSDKSWSENKLEIAYNKGVVDGKLKVLINLKDFMIKNNKNALPFLYIVKLVKDIGKLTKN